MAPLESLARNSESVLHLRCYATPPLTDSCARLQGLVETVLNQVLDAQVPEQIGAQPYERSATRQASRNGYRPRTLTTRVGPLVLHVPQVRDGSFSTTLCARDQGSEQALV